MVYYDTCVCEIFDGKPKGKNNKWKEEKPKKKHKKYCGKKSIHCCLEVESFSLFERKVVNLTSKVVSNHSNEVFKT